MDLVVPPHGTLTGDRLHEAGVASKPDRRIIDLRNLRFIDSSGVVVIATIAHRAFVDGVRLEYIPPVQSRDCSRYLYRMGLTSTLAELGVDARLTRVSRHAVGDRLMELRSFDAEDSSVDDLADQVFRIVGRAAVDRDAVVALVNGITEIGANVAEHSKSPHGYVALQQYDVGRSSHRVSFCIGDAGVGLRASLSTCHQVADDAHAVRLAVTAGVSGTGSVGRGNGVTDVLRSTRGGSLLLWSGDGHGFFRNGEAATDAVVHTSATLVGTLVHAIVRVRQ